MSMILLYPRATSLKRGKRGVINILKKAPKAEKRDLAWWRKYLEDHWVQGG